MKFSLFRKGGAASAKPSQKRERSGISVLTALFLVFSGGVAFQYIYTSGEIEKYETSKKNDQGRQLEIQNTLLQLKYYEDRKSKIERNHQIYAAAKDGPAKREDLAPFPEYGFDSISMKKIEPVGQSGLYLASQKTEFQRVATAVANIESRYPLLQVSRLKMTLPEGIPPLSEEPTYLDTEVELYSPRP